MWREGNITFLLDVMSNKDSGLKLVLFLPTPLPVPIQVELASFLPRVVISNYSVNPICLYRYVGQSSVA